LSHRGKRGETGAQKVVAKRTESRQQVTRGMEPESKEKEDRKRKRKQLKRVERGSTGGPEYACAWGVSIKFDRAPTTSNEKTGNTPREKYVVAGCSHKGELGKRRRDFP